MLVDVMVAQLSRVQDRAVVPQRSNTTRIGRRDIFLPSDPPRRIIAHAWYVVCREKRMHTIGVVAPLMPRLHITSEGGVCQEVNCYSVTTRPKSGHVIC